MAAASELGDDDNAVAAARAARQASTAATQQAGVQKYANIAIGDLNSGDYAGALQAGLDSGKLYGTDYNSITSDPLLQALETSQGLQELDPTKKWSPQDIQNYYSAFGNSSVTQGKQSGTADAGESWGKNGYGIWGDPSKVAGDASTNIATAGDNSAPDLMRFAGAQPTKSFLGKYGVDIAALAATALSFGVAAPALAGALAADGIASGMAAGAIAGGVMGAVNTVAVDAITGKPITAGGVLGGAVGGAAGGGLQGLAAGAINDATGLGSTVSGGLAGAGLGAAKAGLTGGNVGMGALTGGIGGAVQGSGITGNIQSSLTGAGVPSGLAGALTKMGTNYAIGGVTGAAAGALMGGSPNSQPAPGGMQGQVIAPGQQGVQTVGAQQMGQPQVYNGGQPPPGAPGAQQQPASGGNNFFSNGLQSTMLGGGAMQGSSIPGGQAGSNIAAGSPMGVPGAQGTNGNMASTDQTLAQTITGAAPGLIQGAAGVYGSQNAAEKMTQADQNAINTQQSTMGNINNIWGTQQQLGQGADTALGQALGTNGQPADYSGFENMPGYQFAQQQGTQAIQRQAAAMGNAYTPNTAEAVGKYVTGTAMQDYNTYISQLMGAAGLGTTANQGLQTGQQTTGNNISTLQQNQGYAQASGVTGAANAVGGIFGVNGAGTGLINAAGKALSGAGSGGVNPNQPVSPSNPYNYGGQNPNGTTGNGSGNDPYGANVGQYNPANGPTSGDINDLTGGAGNISYDNPGINGLGDQMPEINLPDPTDFGNNFDFSDTGSDFLGGF